jgi:hypothetical protein
VACVPTAQNNSIASNRLVFMALFQVYGQVANTRMPLAIPLDATVVQEESCVPSVTTHTDGT